MPEDVVHDLLNGAPRHFAPTFWAVGLAHAGPKQAEVILNLCDRGHGGARVVRTLLLIDGDGRREPLDAVAVGFLHLTDELACVGGERFHVPTLPLSIERVEGQGGFSRARNAAHDDKAAAWEAYVNILQVMRPCPTDLNPSCIAGLDMVLGRGSGQRFLNPCLSLRSRRERGLRNERVLRTQDGGIPRRRHAGRRARVDLPSLHARHRQRWGSPVSASPYGSGDGVRFR